MSPLGIEVRTLALIFQQASPWSSKTAVHLAANAKLKAVEQEARHLDRMVVLSDDSGLCV